MSDNSATKPLQEIQGRVSPKSSPAPRRLSDSSTEVTAKASDFGAVTARLHIAPESHPVAAVIANNHEHLSPEHCRRRVNASEVRGAGRARPPFCARRLHR